MWQVSDTWGKLTHRVNLMNRICLEKWGASVIEETCCFGSFHFVQRMWSVFWSELFVPVCMETLCGCSLGHPVYRNLKYAIVQFLGNSWIISPWVSPLANYVQWRVLSFGEIWLKKMHSLMCRIKDTNNSYMETLMKCDVTSLSCLLDYYRRFLYVSPGGPLLVS